MNPDPKSALGRKVLDHEIPSWVPDLASDFFITLCCKRRGVNQLCVPTVSNGLLEAARFYHATRKWFPFVFLLMPDHLHMIVAFGQEDRMTKTIADWKRFTAKQYGIDWQDGFFEHRLRGNESWEEKGIYIMNNPVRAGLVERVEDWPHVLRFNYGSGEGVQRVGTDKTATDG